jgi:hypothetical protein
LFHFNEWTLKSPFGPHNTFHKFNEGATFKGGVRNIEYCKQRKTSTMAHFPILVTERVNCDQCLVIINFFKLSYVRRDLRVVFEMGQNLVANQNG